MNDDLTDFQREILAAIGAREMTWRQISHEIIRRRMERGIATEKEQKYKLLREGSTLFVHLNRLEIKGYLLRRTQSEPIPKHIEDNPNTDPELKPMFDHQTYWRKSGKFIPSCKQKGWLGRLIPQLG